MLRGNHESRQMAECYNFAREAKAKYSLSVYGLFQDVFDALPIAAVVSSGHGRYFCVHGGLSPMIRSPSDVNRIERFEEPPDFGPLCDLLWSDPMEQTENNTYPDDYFQENSSRGCGQLFGPQVLMNRFMFCFKSLIRF